MMFRKVSRVFNQTELDTLFKKSVKYLNDKNLKEAVVGFTECLTIEPKNARVLYNRGIAYYLGGAPNKAIDDLSAAYVDDKMRHLALYSRGIVFLDQKEYKKAMEDFNKVLVDDPKKPDVWESKGDCFNGMKQIEDALVCYQKSLDLGGTDDGSAHMKIGKILRGKKRFHESMESFDKLLELSPSNESAYFEKAQSLVGLGKINEAIEELSTGINFNRRNPNGYILREQCYRILGEHGVADSDKEMATKLKADLDTTPKRK
jgi:tetratricopeptide (TPR) repeat protein